MQRIPQALENALEKVTSNAASAIGASLKKYLTDASAELTMQQTQGHTATPLYKRKGSSGLSIGPSLHKTFPHTQRTAVAYSVFRGPGFYGSLSQVIDKSLPLLFRNENDVQAAVEPLRGNAAWGPNLHSSSGRKSVLVYGSLGGIAPYATGSRLIEAQPNAKNWLASLTVIEPEAALTHVGQSIFTHARTDNAEDIEAWDHLVRWRKFLPVEGPSSVSDEASLTLSAYGLSKIGSAARRREILKSMWLHTAPGGVLALIEHGTPEGFAIIRDARSQLLDHSQLVSIAAPCPHHLTCPLDTSITWCHFPVRIQRTRLMQLQLNHPATNWYDEKYSYIIIEKKADVDDKSVAFRSELQETPTVSNQVARVLVPPRKRSGHVLFDLCSQDGTLRQETVAKSHASSGSSFKAFRKAKWGDLVEIPRVALAEKAADPSSVAVNISRRKFNLRRTRRASSK